MDTMQLPYVGAAGIPCKGCEARCPGCHGACGQYADFRARLDALKVSRRDALHDELGFATAARKLKISIHAPANGERQEANHS